MNRRSPDIYPAFARELARLAPGNRLLAACSGGPDSMALWDLLDRWRRETGAFLCVAHVDHGLRGRASRADAAFVRREAARRGAPFLSVRASVPARRRRAGGGVEETARLLRYRALARLARRARCPAVLTAHHLDDQAETVLLGLIRGAGPDGLGGMAPESRWPLGGRGPRLLRPLLAFTRAEILSYAKQRDIPYRIDASNRDRSFFRNRLRPVLRGWERARPGFFRRAGRAAEILRDETAYWSGRLDRLERAVLRRTGDGMTIDLTRLMRYHKVEQRRLLKRLFPAADFAALERLRALAGASGPGALSLPSGGVVRKSARALLFRQGGPSHRRFDPKNAPLPVPGRVSLPDGRLAARPVKRLPPRWRRLAPRRVFVDADRLRGRRLLCRTRRPGDRFRPLGMAGRKKLQDFFVDAGVPREQRENVLVLEDKRRIVWVVGHRLAEDVKLTPATRRIVELTWEPA